MTSTYQQENLMRSGLQDKLKGTPDKDETHNKKEENTVEEPRKEPEWVVQTSEFLIIRQTGKSGRPSEYATLQ